MFILNPSYLLPTRWLGLFVLYIFVYILNLSYVFLKKNIIKLFLEHCSGYLTILMSVGKCAIGFFLLWWVYNYKKKIIKF